MNVDMETLFRLGLGEQETNQNTKQNPAQFDLFDKVVLLRYYKQN